jgi:acylphosphatase
MHLIIHGHVQGVFFRASAVEQARASGLTGWVRNAHDGSVEIVAEGDERTLERLLSWCRHGPSGAEVDRVDQTSGPATGEFRGFQSRY